MKPKRKKIPGSGRKLEYGEPTTTFACRVPVSKKPEIKKMVDKKLKTYKKKK